MPQHLSGLVLLALAAWLVWAARRRKAALQAAARAGAAPAVAPHQSLAVLGELAPPLLLFGLGAGGLEVVLAFLLTDGGGVFSVLDLLGFLALLAAWGHWVVLRARYRPDRPFG
jgi:uncharacterized iron-regulated membrane protein